MAAAVDIQDRAALPLAADCCAPFLREPITADQALELARLLKALAAVLGDTPLAVQGG